MRRMTQLGLGGSMAGGRQFVSWLHARDFCRAVEWLILRPEAEGVYNLCSPSPISNRELMRQLRASLGMPIGLPATRWMLEIGAFLLRTQTELVLKSRKVIPRRLLQEGFQYEFGELRVALKELLV